MSDIARTLLAGLLVAGLSTPVSARKPDIRGYQPQDATAASALPIYVVIEQAELKPEIEYGYINVFGSSQPYQNMSMGQSAGVDLAGGLIASAILNGAAYAKAKRFAQPPYHVIQQAKCNLSIESGLSEAVGTAVRGNWPTASVHVSSLQPGQKLASLIDTDQPRYVFMVSSSLATDFSSVITSIDSEAYLPQAAGAHAARQPAWRDTVIVASDQVAVATSKSQADIDAMVAAESARFVALDLDDRILAVNAAGTNADRRERNRLAALLLEHDHLLKDAASDEWTPTGEALRRAQLLSDHQCDLLNASVRFSSTQAAQLVTALGRGQLPALSSSVQKTAESVPDGRQTLALPGGIFVSQRTGDNVVLGYRSSLLAD
ncbi:MAG: hypothetical protein JWL98_1701 [Xanthomonadaceae bacterium]|nr:hypothetical protein [Xanthomonadaceae bacterium]